MAPLKSPAYCIDAAGKSVGTSVGTIVDPPGVFVGGVGVPLGSMKVGGGDGGGVGGISIPGNGGALWHAQFDDD